MAQRICPPPAVPDWPQRLRRWLPLRPSGYAPAEPSTPNHNVPQGGPKQTAASWPSQVAKLTIGRCLAIRFAVTTGTHRLIAAGIGASRIRHGLGSSAVLENLERAVFRQGDVDDSRTRSVKVAQHPFSVFVGFTICAGVSIDAEDRCGNVRSVLLDDEPECLLPVGGRTIK
jgi:hypothetical protein